MIGWPPGYRQADGDERGDNGMDGKGAEEAEETGGIDGEEAHTESQEQRLGTA